MVAIFVDEICAGRFPSWKAIFAGGEVALNRIDIFTITVEPGLFFGTTEERLAYERQY